MVPADTGGGGPGKMTNPARQVRRPEVAALDDEERGVKKGRHRRFEEARSLKRSVGSEARTCPECGAEPEDSHASWCMAKDAAKN